VLFATVKMLVLQVSFPSLFEDRIGPFEVLISFPLRLKNIINSPCRSSLSPHWLLILSFSTSILAASLSLSMTARTVSLLALTV
jgi:hypothetical protein